MASVVRAAAVVVAVGAACCVLALALAACEAASSARTSADATARLQARFDSAEPGDTVRLRPRTYEHSGVLTITVPGVMIQGDGATLLATDDKTSSVQILADDVHVVNLVLAAPAEGKRWSGLDQHKLVVSGHGDTVSDVAVRGSAAAGVFVDGAVDFTLKHITVSGTRADGIHITNGSRHGTVDDVHTADTGDDGVAVVSYQDDPAPSADIRISDVTIAGTRWGRGISVVGGTGVGIRDVIVDDTDSAGIYIATEGAPYFTDSVQDVTVTGASVHHANTNPGVPQGAVVVSSARPGRRVEGVAISDVSISDTPDSAGRDVAVLVEPGAHIGGIALLHVALDGDGVTPLVSQADSTALTLSGWTADSMLIDPGR